VAADEDLQADEISGDVVKRGKLGLEIHQLSRSVEPELVQYVRCQSNRQRARCRRKTTGTTGKVGARDTSGPVGNLGEARLQRQREACSALGEGGGGSLGDFAVGGVGGAGGVDVDQGRMHSPRSATTPRCILRCQVKVGGLGAGRMPLHEGRCLHIDIPAPIHEVHGRGGIRGQRRFVAEALPSLVPAPIGRGMKSIARRCQGLLH
jgi:hypothetical protein